MLAAPLFSYLGILPYLSLVPFGIFGIVEIFQTLGIGHTPQSWLTCLKDTLDYTLGGVFTTLVLQLVIYCR